MKSEDKKYSISNWDKTSWIPLLQMVVNKEIVNQLTEDMHAGLLSRPLIGLIIVYPHLTGCMF